MNKYRIPVVKAKNLAQRILLNVGISEADAEVTARHLISAELRGYSGHGLRRLLGIANLAKDIVFGSVNERVVEKPGFILFRANARLGIPAVSEAIQSAAANLMERATVVFGISGYVGTTGSLGIYGSEMENSGLTAILMCNSEFAVAPHGSSRSILGSNPIAIYMPGAPIPFCADVATAARSYGSIRDAALAGEAVPLGVVQTTDGTPSTDPNDADNGSMLPMAGHKGYALGLAVELLCGPLLGGKAGRDAVHGSNGFFGILIRSDAARPLVEVNADMQALFSEIKSSPLAPGASQIRIPGESSIRAKHKEYINLSITLFNQLNELKDH